MTGANLKAAKVTWATQPGGGRSEMQINGRSAAEIKFNRHQHVPLFVLQIPLFVRSVPPMNTEFRLSYPNLIILPTDL